MLFFRTERDICGYLIMNDSTYDVNKIITKESPTLRLTTWIAQNEFDFRHFIIMKHNQSSIYKYLSFTLDSLDECESLRLRLISMALDSLDECRYVRVSHEKKGYTVSAFSICDIGWGEMLIIKTITNGPACYYIVPKKGKWRGDTHSDKRVIGDGVEIVR